jgi:predicted DNA-binding transcriptional regulator AlpA
MSPVPDEELREAFSRHGEAVGRRWQVKVFRVAPSDERLPGVRVELTCDDATVLAALILASVGPRGSVTDVCLGTAAVARQLHVSQATIRSWLARNLPRQNPFPQPEKLSGRNQWPQAAIDTWRVRQTQIEKQQHRGRTRAHRRATNRSQPQRS